MAARKTIHVHVLLDKLNRYIDGDSPVAQRIERNLEDEHLTPAQAYRAAIAHVLEMVLLDTDNYEGYRYTDGHEAVWNRDYDPTKREYYWPRTLSKAKTGR